MIYEKDWASNEFFTLMLSEALSRNLNCKDIAQEILDYRNKTTGNDSSGGPNSSGEGSCSTFKNEGINWVTGQFSQKKQAVLFIHFIYFAVKHLFM